MLDVRPLKANRNQNVGDFSVPRELPGSLFASILVAGGGEPFSVDLAVYSEPKPRLLVTAAGCSVLTASTSVHVVPPVSRGASTKRGFWRRLHPATSDTEAREETIEKRD